MMKRRRIFVVLVLVLIVMAGAVLSVSAASGQAYGDKAVVCKNWINPIEDHAYSYITRNSDLPVNNFLYVEMNIQYQEGNNFYWEDPYIDGGTDIEEARTDRWRYSIMANTTTFTAESEGCPIYTDTLTATP